MKLEIWMKLTDFSSSFAVLMSFSSSLCNESRALWRLSSRNSFAPASLFVRLCVRALLLLTDKVS